jgi:midasin
LIPSQVAACFASSVEDVLPVSATNTDTRTSLNQILTFVECTKNRPFKNAVQKYLRPTLHHFLSQRQSRQHSIAALGSCWIALSRTILDLFVPDAPIDPAAIKNCAAGLWKQQESLLSEQIYLHSQLEQLTTGNSENVIVIYLRTQLAEALDHLNEIPSLPLRQDISRLHLFWSEVAQFQTHIISPAKMEALLLSLGSRDESAILRENVLQQSMAGFCQRLDSVYPEFSDINAPLQLAILYLRMGLRLVACTPIPSSDPIADHVTNLSSSLVAFPSIRASASILADSEYGSSVVAPFRHLLLNLAAVAVDTDSGIGIDTHIEVIETTYSQAQRLWLIDRAREGEIAAASSSLYRHKPLDYDDVGEAEMEEREFLLLFPQFEDALDPDSQNQNNAKSGQSAEMQHGGTMVCIFCLHAFSIGLTGL